MVWISVHQHWLTTPCTITDPFVIYEWICYQYWHMPQDTLPSIQLNTCGPHSVMPLLELFYHHAFQVSHYHQQNNENANVEVKRKSFLIMQCLLVLPIGKIWLDNFPINENAHIVKCNQDKLLFNDYEEVKKFLSCPPWDLHKYSKLNKEFQEMLNHIDHHLNWSFFWNA